MLFQRITLRSADDVEQLLTFLAAPALFDHAITRYIDSLHLIEDCAAFASIPWSHQVLLRLPLNELRVTRCFKASTDFALWINISFLLFAGKDRAPLNSDLQTAISTFCHLCVSLHRLQHSPPELHAFVIPHISPETRAVAALAYNYRLADIASVELHLDGAEDLQLYTQAASLTCPDFDDAAQYTLLDQLPAIFVATANTCIYRSSINLQLKNSEACRTLVASILESRVFAEPSTFVRRCFRVSPPDNLGYTVADILSAPRSIGEGDQCVTLTTAQRVEWVLRLTWRTNFEITNKRDEYLCELQDAACEMRRVGRRTQGLHRSGCDEGGDEGQARG
ncbi:hypothetical protein PsYK624_123420 [Phanerochaete sordida]|uniref:Uncharacterized protein n=1 Tax=Phanerochaete sordida TaxID=48140 RepID=A0A9P3GKW9_9APHY|nr:hypothetical protein PsYK624_123420 [Phanerochaete sordida]